MPTRKRRRIVPGMFIAAGILGLGLAAASQLNLNWSGVYQDGTVVVDADCQEGPITVSFSDPDFQGSAAGNVAPWAIATIDFQDVDEACNGYSYQAAVRIEGPTDSGWQELGTAGIVSAPSIKAPLDGIAPHTITDVALTIHSAQD